MKKVWKMKSEKLKVKKKIKMKKKKRILSSKSEFCENSDPKNSNGILQILKSEFWENSQND